VATGIAQLGQTLSAQIAWPARCIFESLMLERTLSHFLLESGVDIGLFGYLAHHACLRLSKAIQFFKGIKT
jgi:hypothetical protein